MAIEINQDYIFTFKGGPDEDEIVEDHYEDGRISDPVWDNYNWWSDLNGTVVTVMSIGSTGNGSAKKNLYKVHLKDGGYTHWFTALGSELKPISSPATTTSDCSCDLSALMVRGCRCGGS